MCRLEKYWVRNQSNLRSALCGQNQKRKGASRVEKEVWPLSQFLREEGKDLDGDHDYSTESGQQCQNLPLLNGTLA